MIVDFEKYQYSIKEVIFDDNEPIIKLVLNENLILKLIPIGDCCSVSILEKYEDYDFQKLIDKTITSIKCIEFPDDYKFTEEKNIIGFNDCVSHHLYEIRFKDSDETFKFMLINYSNGYYDGWLELEIENK
jgi:hypothetical protein